MENSASLPLKKAVNAARFVIRSRTGAAILKTSYQQKSDIVLEKSAHLLKGIQKKEMRRLERDRSRFIIDQNGKLKVSNAENTESVCTPRSSKLSSSVSKKTAQRLLRENGRPNKESLAKLNEESERKGSSREEKAPKDLEQENKYNRDAVLYRRDFVPNFSKSPRPAWENHDEQEEVDGKEDQGNSKSSENVELTKRKLLHHNLDFFGSDKRLEIWLNEVELANVERKLSSERRKKRKQRNSPAKDPEHEVSMPKIDFYEDSKLLNPQDLEDSGKSDYNNSCSLKLPRLNQTPSSSPTESQRRSGGKIASNKSLDDPRFTRLIDSLAPSNNSLKLPKIFNKTNDRAG